MLWPLPKSDHAVSSSSGLALVAAALCLLPIETMVHRLYGWPMVAAVIVEYYLMGILFALALLKTRSLAVPLALHALRNLVNPILIDLVKITHADFVRCLFGNS